MDYLGLKSITDLPKLKDFNQVDNSIGEPAPVEEDADDNTSNGISEDGEPGADEQPVEPTGVSDDEITTTQSDDSEE